MNKNDIIINNERQPILRAGIWNCILLLMPGVPWIIHRFFNEFYSDGIVLEILIISISIFMLLKAYFGLICRISIENRKFLAIVLPHCTKKIALEDIRKCEIYGLSTSKWIFILIMGGLFKLPNFYYFHALRTNYGSYEKTIDGLINLLLPYFNLERKKTAIIFKAKQ